MLGREGLHRDVLLEVVTAAGGHQPQSYLTTGNVTFAAHSDAVLDVVNQLESSVADVLGRHEMIAVRSREWLRALVERDPFGAYDEQAWHQEAAFLSASAQPLVQPSIPKTGSTVVVELGSRELLTVRPVGGPRGPHANPLLERLTGAPATSRGWRTLRRLARDAHSA